MKKLLYTDKVGINFGDLWAVKNIDFTVKEKEIIGLIGPNGSGKTTFFNLISGIYTPTKGKIYYKDKGITGLLPNQIKERGIARTFQSSRLCWDLSVLDNVLAGLQSEWETNWKTILFNIKKSDQEISDGIDKAINLLGYFNKDLIDKRFEQVKNIPHIDRRRIEICRALISEPDLLLLDEPSAGLNNEETSEMMKHIKNVQERNKKISIIIIEHDMSVISDVSGFVIVFNAGQEIARGKFEEISKDKNVRLAYLGGTQ